MRSVRKNRKAFPAALRRDGRGGRRIGGSRERVAPSSSTLWRRVSPRALRFARDSPVEGDGFEPSVPGAKEPVSFAEGELRGIERGRPTKVVSLRGTDGSNPSPSSGESGANLTSLIRAVHWDSLREPPHRMPPPRNRQCRGSRAWAASLTFSRAVISGKRG